MFVNKYKYDRIYIIADNSEDSSKIQNLLFSFGIYWCSGDKSPLYLDAGTIIFDVFLGNKVSIEKPYISYTTNTELFNETVKRIGSDPKVYNIDDYMDIKNILEYGGILPTYKPRKIDRTLEIFSNFLIESNHYEETSWTVTKGGKEITATIQEINNYLKDGEIIKIPVKDIQDMCIHKDKNDKETLKRSEQSNLYYPIIIVKQNNQYVMILDGHHRLKKAIVNNIDYIKAKVLDLDISPKKYKILFGSLDESKYKVKVDIQNESIKDLMKPKSEEEFEEILKKYNKKYNFKKLYDNFWIVFRKDWKQLYQGNEYEVINYLKNQEKTEEKFIFENFENYKYDVIRVRIDNNPELSEIIQYLCFSHNITWYNNSSEYFYISLDNYCIDISFREERLYLSPTIKGEIGQVTLSYYNENGFKVDPKIYTEKDLPLIKSILYRGHIEPSYKSKKIKRDI